MPVSFIGEIQGVKNGRDSNNCWVDVTIRMPVSKVRLDSSNEKQIIDAYRNRSVVGGTLQAVEEPLWPEYPPPENPNQTSMQMQGD